MSSLEWRLRRLEERASASSPGNGGSAARRELARKFENAIVAAGAGEGPEPFDPQALGWQSPVGMAARIVALAVEGHPAEREARRVLAETLAARGLAGDALEGLVGGYISAMRRSIARPSTQARPDDGADLEAGARR